MVLLFACLMAFAHGDFVQVSTPFGPVKGTAGKIALEFRGIPYAQPPVKALRFKKPQPIEKWDTPIEALADAPGCPQKCTLPYQTCPQQIDESCLFLNIFTPLNASSSSARVPVMVFIHGGDFKQGYGGGLLFDGSTLASVKNLIVVSVQYRLGALGFLYTGSSADSAVGNFGTFDQEQALIFVKEAIGSFGGDPSRVTLFGQSAGGASVAALTTMPSASGLFRNAITESFPFGLPFRSTKSWPKFADYFVKLLGCAGKGLTCLQDVPLQTLLDAAAKAETDIALELGNFLDLFEPWTPTVGTPEIPYQIYHAFTRSTSPPTLPMAMGTVTDEGTIFVYGAFGTPLKQAEEAALLGAAFGAKHLSKMLQRYPLLPTEKAANDVRNRTARIVTDGLFHCPARNVSLGRSSSSSIGGSWLYHFDQVAKFMAPVWANNSNAPECTDRVCHAEELAYVFHANLSLIQGAGLSWAAAPVDSELSLSMVDYWGNVAVDGDPGSSGHGSSGSAGLRWPKFDADTQSTLRLKAHDGGNVVEAGAYKSKCEFWDSTGYDWLDALEP